MCVYFIYVVSEVLGSPKALMRSRWCADFMRYSLHLYPPHECVRRTVMSNRCILQHRYLVPSITHPKPNFLSVAVLLVKYIATDGPIGTMPDYSPGILHTDLRLILI